MSRAHRKIRILHLRLRTAALDGQTIWIIVYIIYMLLCVFIRS